VLRTRHSDNNTVVDEKVDESKTEGFLFFSGLRVLSDDRLPSRENLNFEVLEYLYSPLSTLHSPLSTISMTILQYSITVLVQMKVLPYWAKHDCTAFKNLNSPGSTMPLLPGSAIYAQVFCRELVLQYFKYNT
jgi:hypothetical protein